MAKRIFKVITPSIAMLALVYIMRDGKDILNGLFFIFPVLYIALGIICSSFVWELFICVFLTSLALIIPINLFFNMGTCIEWALFYIALGSASYFVKCLVKKAVKK